MNFLPRPDVDENKVAKFESPRSTNLGKILHAADLHGKEFAINYASTFVPKKYLNNATKSIDKHLASKPEPAKRVRERPSVPRSLRITQAVTPGILPTKKEDTESNLTSGKNKYGDPIGTMYRGGNPAFYSDYTGADGTYTPQDSFKDQQSRWQAPQSPQRMPSPSPMRLPNVEYEQKPKTPQKRYMESAQKYKDQYTSNLRRRGIRNESTNIEVTENNSNVGNDYSNNTNNQNDYSVNFSGNNSDGGFSNLQGAAAYAALNNNQARRSNSELSGSTRAAKASEDAHKKVDGRGRAQRMYNMTGMDQNYWRSKADSQQNFYLGDIFKMNAGDYKLPSPPSNPFDEDKTDEYYKDGLERIENS